MTNTKLVRDNASVNVIDRFGRVRSFGSGRTPGSGGNHNDHDDDENEHYDFDDDDDYDGADRDLVPGNKSPRIITEDNLLLSNNYKEKKGGLFSDDMFEPRVDDKDK